ncbi:Transposase [Paracholeplasma brassicae]|uniref:Transposase n=1 Tax=Acholeplasma brassicae TaxID=61635 RepID=U4KSA0_9MOLU|nr:Transposase [Paracholeplasma brassicae]
MDVSKGKSYYQGFIEIDKPANKATPIEHDLEGFKFVYELGQTLKETYSDVVYVFESTGIYHKALETFLMNHDEKCIILNPLEASKIRKTDLRSTKTDARDCKGIAKAYFMKDFRLHDQKDELYEKLQSMNGHYNFLIQQLREMKVHFRNALDIVYPRFDVVYPNPYLDIPMSILKRYAHPDELKNKRFETIVKYIMKDTKHRGPKAMDEAKKLKGFIDNVSSGCRSSAFEVTILKTMVNKISDQEVEIELCLDEMRELVSEVPLYHQLMSVPGIGDNLAIRLIGELGDLDRFERSEQLVAYAGIDPRVYQSGQMTGEHLHITKKGNKHLRTLLFLAMSSNVRIGKTNIILDFYNKKRQQTNPLVYKAALIACANKLLRIIFGMYKSGKNFHK